MADITWFGRTLRVHAVLVFSLMIAACGGGEDEGSTGGNGEVGVVMGSSTPPPVNTDNETDGQPTVVGAINETPITITGTVIDGPVTDAIITIRDANDAFVAATRSDSRAHYRADIPANSIFPLTLTATGGTNLTNNAPPSFTLVSAIMGPSDSIANITSQTTLIVKTAQAMSNSLTSANLHAANESILITFNAGLDTTMVPNPITTPVSEQNIAHVVKANEVLAEIIRRNFSTLRGVYPGYTQDELISALSADMVDGALDGNGAPGTNPITSSIVSIGSGQVLIEALSNNLQVDGDKATNVLDNAIGIVEPTSNQDTGDVVINMDILLNTRAAIIAASAVTPTIALSDIQSSLDSIEPGTSPTEVVAILPPDTADSFNKAIIQTVSSVQNPVPGNPSATALLLVSSSADRTNPAALHGMRLTGSHHIFLDFLSTASNVVRVSFYLDNGAAIGIPTRVENISPYDFSGTGSDKRSAKPIDTSTLTDGSHSITAIIDHDNGQRDFTTAVFTVANKTQVLESESNIELLTSNTATHIPSIGLNGAVISGLQYVNLKVSSDITQAIFYLDDPMAIGTPRQIENIPPYDFVGTASDGSGKPFNSNTLTNGLHSITVLVIRDDESQEIRTAAFSVGNDLTNATDNNPTTSNDGTLTLTWQPNSDIIQGYKVFKGTTEDSVESEITDISIYSGGFDPTAPTVKYDSLFELGLQPGEEICFKVRAYNADGLSDESLPACTTAPHTI